MGSSTPGDVIWTTLAVPILLSERVVGLMRDLELTGWDVIPVELRGKHGESLPTYYFLSVRGRCGPIDNNRSVRFETNMPGGVYPRWRGIYFDPATWDGSDLFTSSCDVAWVFVVDEVKKAFEKAKVQNVLFTPLNEVERRKL